MKYKAGDKPRIVGNSCNHGFKNGEEVEILLARYMVENKGGATFYVNESDLEPIEPVQEEESNECAIMSEPSLKEVWDNDEDERWSKELDKLNRPRKITSEVRERLKTSGDSERRKELPAQMEKEEKRTKKRARWEDGAWELFIDSEVIGAMSEWIKKNVEAPLKEQISEAESTISNLRKEIEELKKQKI